MSTKVIAAFVAILATVLPLIGVDIGSEALTETIQNILVIGSGIYVWLRTITKENLNIVGVAK